MPSKCFTTSQCRPSGEDDCDRGEGRRNVLPFGHACSPSSYCRLRKKLTNPSTLRSATPQPLVDGMLSDLPRAHQKHVAPRLIRAENN